MTDLGPLQSALDTADSPLPTGATRLFHGRGHCYPGLEFINIDWFEPVLWCVAYGDVNEVTMARIEALLGEFAAARDEVHCALLQRRGAGEASVTCLYGEVPAQCLARENDTRFELHFGRNQNIGYFPDARPGRDWVRANAQGKRVLNLFAYTCAFSVAALRGGATKVVNIDMARPAIATGQKNHALNDLPLGDAVFLPHDIFRSTRKLEKLGPYDLVIIDPPSRQKRSFEADKDYGRLLGTLRPMLAPGAQVLACLNAPYLDANFLPALFAAHLPGYRLQQRLAQRPDFPEQDLDRCLKLQVFAPAH